MQVIEFCVHIEKVKQSAIQCNESSCEVIGCVHQLVMHQHPAVSIGTVSVSRCIKGPLDVLAVYQLNFCQIAMC